MEAIRDPNTDQICSNSMNKKVFRKKEAEMTSIGMGKVLEDKSSRRDIPLRYDGKEDLRIVAKVPLKEG